MLLDQIIDMEIKLLKEKRLPKTILINYNNYKALLKELEEDGYIEYIHNMKIQFVKSSTIVLI